MTYTVQKMHCTICGRQYPWTCNYGFSKSRTCSRECSEEFNWRETLSIMGKEYYSHPTESDQPAK